MEPTPDHELRSLYYPESTAPPCWCNHPDEEHVLLKPPTLEKLAVVGCRACTFAEFVFAAYDGINVRAEFVARSATEPAVASLIRYIDLMKRAADAGIAGKDHRAELAEMDKLMDEIVQLLILQHLPDEPDA